MTTSRKIRAIAAGGAVLGLGAVVTLAAWSDSEFAQGMFGTGTFGIEAATGEGTYGEHATEGEALELAFPLDEGETAVDLAPGETVTATWNIKNVEGGEDSVVTVQDPAFIETFGDALSTEVLLNGAPLAADRTFELVGQDPAQLTIEVTLADTFTENENEAQSTIVYEVVADQLTDDAEPAV